jgi:hypothetical protein
MNTNTNPLVLRHDKFGSFYRLKEGVLECQPQMADPKHNSPHPDEWVEVDWDRGVEPEDLAEMKGIEASLQTCEDCDCEGTGRIDDHQAYDGGYCDCPAAEGAQEADCDAQAQIDEERPDSCYDLD